MNIEDKITLLPNKPGCYMYFNNQGKIIYVGKAKDLKKRVASYFKSAHDIKTTRLVREIHDVQVIVTNNEKEALLLEENLIKKNKPRFNVLLNDDKHYPYIAITNEKDPEYKYIRNYDKRYKKVFGPLPDGTSAWKILKALELLYPLRRCKGNLGKPCTYFHIAQCSGACFKDVEQEYYKEVIKKVNNFFSGKDDEVKNKLTTRMLNAAENLQYEEAGRIKGVIDNMNLALFKQDVEVEKFGNVDVFNYWMEEGKICFTTLFYLNGKLSFRDSTIFEYADQDIDDLFKGYVMQIYEKNVVPKTIVVPDEIKTDDLELIYENSVTKAARKYKAVVDLSLKNAKEYMRMSLLSTDTLNNKHQELLEQLQTLLKLPTFPYHIEVFDVANIYDEFVTGAMVVFKNGYPSKKDFRRYNIDIQHQDDYHRMQYMIYRRYQKDLFKKDKLPDLIIMDGGKIQVSAANSQLELLNVKIPVIGLIKNDAHKTERLLNYDGNEVDIKSHKDLFNLLANFQERVHNFAISQFRHRKEKGVFK